MINTVTIVGNLGQDPEIRYTPSGVPVANFTVAVNEVYTNKDGEKVKKVHWFKVTAFKRLAEIVGEYCAKVPGSASGGSCSIASGRMTRAATTASWRSGRASSNS